MSNHMAEDNINSLTLDEMLEQKLREHFRRKEQDEWFDAKDLQDDANQRDAFIQDEMEKAKKKLLTILLTMIDIPE